MTELQVYRDDGPLVAWLGRQLAGCRSPDARPLAWLGPPLVRLVEYGWLIALTAVVDGDALPVCFALLGVLAFHHYDVVYRLRLGVPASPWARAAGGGWDSRILVFSLLALAGVLGPGLLVGAVGLGAVYAADSASSWIRFSGSGQPEALGDDWDVVE